MADQSASLKTLTTPSGITVEFDDNNPIVSISTPERNQIILNDTEKQITIADQNGNQILMTPSGIVIKSAKSISLEASEKLSLKGDMGVNIQAPSGDINLNGLNIRNSAEMQYTGNGGVSTQISGTSELTLKGALIMIN